MKREDVTKIFEGATKEQIDQLLDINSADIGAAKKGSTQLQADLDATNKALTDGRDAVWGSIACRLRSVKCQICRMRR